MSQWGKSSKNLAAPAAAVGEVPVQKVEKIEVLNLVPTKFGPVGNPTRQQPPAPVDGAGKPDINWEARIFIDETKKRWNLDHKPDSPRSDDINWRMTSRLSDDTKKRWNLGHKSFRATGRR